ncbi:MAG: acylphosphatase [Gammaproteobacteria bacterium]|nr:acylphosphatase [Gammaproteobacteria bacterium]
MICLRYLISGRVQGVFYRASAQRQAIALGLCGWVRNLTDGRVELLACGDSAALNELEKWLKIGPEYAKVSNIEIITENAEVLSENFEIRATSSL